jgi:hypothetical protein
MLSCHERLLKRGYHSLPWNFLLFAISLRDLPRKSCAPRHGGDGGCSLMFRNDTRQKGKKLPVGEKACHHRNVMPVTVQIA